MSSLLQRERTTLKLLEQLLVDQRHTLELGDLVPVGDLYDVIESDDEPFSQAMKIRFDRAKRLYPTKAGAQPSHQHPGATTGSRLSQDDNRDDNLVDHVDFAHARSSPL